MASNSLRAASTITIAEYASKYVEKEGGGGETIGSTDRRLVIHSNLNKRLKAVYCWTGKKWIDRVDVTDVFEFDNLNSSSFLYPDTILFILEGSSVVVVVLDVANEIKADFEAYKDYRSSVIPLHRVACGETDIRTKVSRFLDLNPDDYYEYNGVTTDTGELTLTNSSKNEHFAEKDLVRLLTHELVDRIPFVTVRDNNAFVPRIVYANPDSFIEYYVRASTNDDRRTYSNLYHDFVSNLLQDLSKYVLIFTDPKANELFVVNYLNQVKNNDGFVYLYVRPVLRQVQDMDSRTVYEQEIDFIEGDKWILKWDFLFHNRLEIIQNTNGGETFYSQPFQYDDTHLFKPMDADINVGFHYSLLPPIV